MTLEAKDNRYVLRYADKSTEKVTNFTFKIHAEVFGKKCGYVYEVKRFDGTKRKCFVPAVKNTPHAWLGQVRQQLPGLLFNKKANSVFRDHLFTECADFQSKEDRRCLKFTDVIGQPDPSEPIWVFSSQLHMTSDGLDIPENEQSFFYQSYSLSTDHVIHPGGKESLLKLWSLAPRGKNKIPFLLSLAAGGAALHAPTFQRRFGVQPSYVLYSKETGTGKTTAMTAALKACGSSHIFSKSTTTQYVMQLASQTTLPIGLDDVKSKAKEKNSAVGFFNGRVLARKSIGEKEIKAGFVMTTNMNTAHSARNDDRLVFVPFFKQGEERMSNQEVQIILQSTRQPIDYMVALHSAFTAEETPARIYKIVRQVKDILKLKDSASFNYALLLYTTRLLCSKLPDVNFKDVVKFMKTSWKEKLSELYAGQDGTF